jgi:hypothetical protein
MPLAEDLEEAEDEEEVSPMRGRRDDGRGVTFDCVMESIQATRHAKGFELGTVDYLRGRGVPAELLPGRRGIELSPTVVVDVHVEVD